MSTYTTYKFWTDRMFRVMCPSSAERKKYTPERACREMIHLLLNEGNRLDATIFLSEYLFRNDKNALHIFIEDKQLIESLLYQKYYPRLEYFELPSSNVMFHFPVGCSFNQQPLNSILVSDNTEPQLAIMNKMYRDVENNESIKKGTFDYDIAIRRISVITDSTYNKMRLKGGSVFSKAIFTDSREKIVKCIKMFEKDDLNFDLVDEYHKVNILKGKISEQSDEAKKGIRFCSNILSVFGMLCMYMQAFPKCVKDGLPKTKLPEAPDDYKQCLHIATSPKVVTQKRVVTRSGDKITIHFRRGHYRFLTAERYVNKRGTLIWQSETNVNEDEKTSKTVTL